jgi:hypothetical protein
MSDFFKDIMRSISKGDTSAVESFFKLPGGRRYLENITLILINTLPHHYNEKEELYRDFVAVLDNMEQRIERLNEGEAILNNIFKDEEPLK